jgi:hypothetical protein
MQLRRNSTALAALAFATLLTACFGDNSEDQEGPGPGPGPGGSAPSIVEISGSDELDLGDSIDVTVKVRGEANEQLSVAVESKLGGGFNPQNKVVITDAAGEGSFTTRYTSGTTAGLDTLTFNVSDLEAKSKTATKDVTLYDIERFGNVTPLAETGTNQPAGFLVAYPMTLTTARLVRKLGIVHPPQATQVRVQVGLYATDTATSVTAITKTTATLVTGLNDIPIPPTPLAAGSYWMVVAYEGSPSIYRSTTIPIALRYKLTHDFDVGLTDKITDLMTSSGTQYYIRNFYLVLRK